MKMQSRIGYVRDLSALQSTDCGIYFGKIRAEIDEWTGGPARIRTENQSIMSALL
jgi:hypothetical protein